MDFQIDPTKISTDNIERFFNKEEWQKMSEYEKLQYRNRMANYQALLQMGKKKKKTFIFLHFYFLINNQSQSWIFFRLILYRQYLCKYVSGGGIYKLNLVEVWLAWFFKC